MDYSLVKQALADAVTAAEIPKLSSYAYLPDNPVLYEDLSLAPSHPLRFYVSVQFSPGAALDPFIFTEAGHTLPVSRPVPVHMPPRVLQRRRPPPQRGACLANRSSHFASQTQPKHPRHAIGEYEDLLPGRNLHP